MNADGSNQRRLTDSPSDDSDPAWSPDGGTIVFACDNEICVMDADGGNRRALATLPGFPVGPTWSPTEARSPLARSAVVSGPCDWAAST